MKKLTALLIALAVLGMAFPAFAQSEGDDVPSEFIDIEQMLIEGEFKEPEVHIVDPNTKIGFERLSKLKRSFMPKIAESTSNSSLQ